MPISLAYPSLSREEGLLATEAGRGSRITSGNDRFGLMILVEHQLDGDAMQSVRCQCGCLHSRHRVMRSTGVSEHVLGEGSGDQIYHSSVAVGAVAAAAVACSPSCLACHPACGKCFIAEMQTPTVHAW